MTKQHAGPSTGFYSIPIQTTATPETTPVHAPLIHINNQPQITIKLAEPKPFNGNTTQAHAWLSALKWYFISVGLVYKVIEASGTLEAYQYAVALMVGNAARWMDRLELLGHAPNSFLEFEKLFIN